jgi:predicted RNA binding protein YcfA (HicA-like mRNA interferase family)
MTKLPSSDKVVKVLKEKGYYLKSQKGSHLKFVMGMILPKPILFFCSFVEI